MYPERAANNNYAFCLPLEEDKKYLTESTHSNKGLLLRSFFQILRQSGRVSIAHLRDFRTYKPRRLAVHTHAVTSDRCQDRRDYSTSQGHGHVQRATGPFQLMLRQPTAYER